MKKIIFLSLIVFGFLKISGAQKVHSHHGKKHSHPETIPIISQSVEQMTKAGSIFINSLSEQQKKELIYNFKDDKARTYWTNAPTHSQSRNGLPMGRLSIVQRKLFHQLLISSTSSQGYYKIWAAIQGDDELKLEGENRELSSDKFYGKNQSLGAIGYYISFYGNPVLDSKWAYMLTGHHLAVNFTVIDGKTTFVPMFYGSDPAYINRGQHAGYTFLPQERNRGYELLQSLSEKQKNKTVIASDYPFNKFGPIDFKGPGSKDRKIENRGIRGDQLTISQQKLLWVLIKEYVNNADFDVAEEWMSRIENDGLKKLYFMWMGPTDSSEKIFFRVNGPSILIDFADQRTGFDWNTHPHTIVRDPSNDYGENWMQRHIEEYHK